jgi:hypothetical protein
MAHSLDFLDGLARAAYERPLFKCRYGYACVTFAELAQAVFFDDLHLFQM